MQGAIAPSCDMNEHDLDPGFDFEGFARRLADAIFPEKPTSFARRASVSSGLMFKYLKGEGASGHRLDVVARIAETAGVSLDWLVFGRGDGESTGGDLVKIPRFDATLAAGAGSWNEGRRQLDEIPFTRSFLLKRLGRTSTVGLSVLEAAGDSMEPLIHDGDLVLIDEADTRVRDGVFAFLLDDEARVKRFRRTMSGVTISSDNPNYPEERLEGEDMGRLNVIGRLRWFGRTIS